MSRMRVYVTVCDYTNCSKEASTRIRFAIENGPMRHYDFCPDHAKLFVRVQESVVSKRLARTPLGGLPTFATDEEAAKAARRAERAAGRVLTAPETAPGDEKPSPEGKGPGTAPKPPRGPRRRKG